MARREFLRAGSVPLVSMGLSQLLYARASAQAAAVKAKAKACILLFMWGGPAHQDTWDMKPDGLAEYRGEFKPIKTNVPGIHICEHLPLLAQRADKLAIIRSMTHKDVDHTTATHLPLTGREIPKRGGPRADDWPNYGAVLARLGRGKGPLPPYVSMMPVVPNGAPRFVEESHGQDAGWLGSIYNPMRIDTDASKPDYHPADISLHADVPQARTNRRRELLQSLETQRRQLEEHPEITASNSHYERAFSLLASRHAADAFDLTKEDQRLRERYGMNIHGQAVLQARRLVEAGVPLVTVFWQNDGITNVSVYWDTHARNFIDLKTRLCPVTDQAFSALLDDLEARGLLKETLGCLDWRDGTHTKSGTVGRRWSRRGPRRPRPLAACLYHCACGRRHPGRHRAWRQRPFRSLSG